MPDITFVGDTYKRLMIVSQIKMIVQIRAVRVCGHVVGCPGLMIGQQPVCPIGSRKPLKYLFKNLVRWERIVL